MRFVLCRLLFQHFREAPESTRCQEAAFEIQHRVLDVGSQELLGVGLLMLWGLESTLTPNNVPLKDIADSNHLEGP